jgi:hypothetical protein
MAKYVITWSSKHDSGSKTEHFATIAHGWIVKLRNRGARDLTVQVTRDGEVIELKHVEALAKYETERLTGRAGRPRYKPPPAR